MAADTNNYIELPGAAVGAPLQLYHKPGSSQPEAFAWLTEPGVYYGNLNWSLGPGKKELDHLATHRLLPYSSAGSDPPTSPLAVVGIFDNAWLLHRLLPHKSANSDLPTSS